MADKKNKRKIELTTQLDADIAAVWKALTDAEELKRWFPLDAAVKPGRGGEVQLSWGDYHIWKFRIQEAIEHKYLKMVYEHGSDFQEMDPDKRHPGQTLNSDAAQLVLEYYLETEKGRTFLRLVHSGFGPDTNWDDEYNAVNRGWHSEMQSLKHYISRHPGKDRAVAWCRIVLPDNADVAAAWHRLMHEEACFTGAGNTYTLRSPQGLQYEGTILLLNPPYDFTGTVQHLNDALLRVTVEVFGRYREISVWLAAYELPSEELTAFKQEWDALLHRLFNP
jgi:uncharacterized protein YndB with AHSA1/START domain